MELYKPLSLIRGVPQGKASVGCAGKSGVGALPAGDGRADGTTSPGKEGHRLSQKKPARVRTKKMDFERNEAHPLCLRLLRRTRHF